MTRRLLALALAAAGVLAAQDPPTRAGRISYVSGSVSFDPAGVDQWAPATVNRPLTIGDQLFSDNGARAEVHVPGAAFRLGDRTAFEFMNLDDHTVQVRLSEGTLDLRIRNVYGSIEIDAPNLAFTISHPGEYRIDTNPDNLQSLVTVHDGEGQVASSGGTFTVPMGQQAVVTGQDQSAQYQIRSAPGPDAFDNWVISRNRRDDRYAQSRYVSPQVVGYEDLGEYGSWRSAPDYGEVWVPNSVPAGWAPYQDGHWAWVEPWGWTWVDDEPWGFAPFHYGRWAFVNGYWGWCPGPLAVAPIYAPALVAWVGFGGGFGASIGFGAGPAVGWFPLGPRDVYIPAFAASRAFVTRINVTNTTVINTTNVTNMYNSYARTGSIPVNTYMNRAVPGAVMAAPQNAIAGAQPVRQFAKRMQPNQLSSIKAVSSAPHVAPQVISVLGRPSAGNAAHPPAAVLSRPVVARVTPPPAPPSFQQRQAVLAKNPGRPMPVAQLHQLSRSAPAATALRPPVKIVSRARPITPQSANVRVPTNIPPAAQPQRSPVPRRVYQPPPAQAQRSTTPPAAQPPHPQAPQRSFEPPAVQAHRSNTPPQHSPVPQRAYQPPVSAQARQPLPAHEQPRVQTQPRPAAAPIVHPQPPTQPVQPHVQQPHVQPQPHVQQPRVQPQPRQAAPPPARQMPPPPPQEPHVQQPRVQPQPHPAVPPHPAPRNPPPERKPEPHD